MWLAGGGIRGGMVYGESDDFSYNIVDKPCHVNDLNATILHCLGINHEAFAFRFQGLDQRLTGVEPQHVIQDLLVDRYPLSALPQHFYAHDTEVVVSCALYAYSRV